MKLMINNQVYQVPREYEQRIMLDLWQKEALPWYEKLDRHWQVVGMLPSRALLAFMERQVRKEASEQGMDPEEAAARLKMPGRDTDPNLWLGLCLANLLFEGLNHVTLVCRTDGATIDDFHLEVEGGRTAPDPDLIEGPRQTG